MINELIQAISVALHAEFGYENHMEEIKQNLTEPCFFIQCLNPTTELFLGLKDSKQRYFKQNQFCIKYFPESEEGYEAECNAIGERMFWCLEYITVDGRMVRGTQMRYEMADGTLNFFINYDGFVYREEEVDTMETLESTTMPKEGN